MSERGRVKSRKSPASTRSKATPAKAAAPKASSAAAKPRKGAAGASAGKSSTRRTADPATGTVALDAPSLMARVIRLETERDRLKAQLEKAESRIRELEESREQVVNRIDWVIDSLRSLVDE